MRLFLIFKVESFISGKKKYIRTFLIFGLESSIFRNIRTFLEFAFQDFHFLIFFNIRGKRFHFQKYNNFLNIRVRLGF